jgi:hypothetical protein
MLRERSRICESTRRLTFSGAGTGCGGLAYECCLEFPERKIQYPGLGPLASLQHLCYNGRALGGGDRPARSETVIRCPKPHCRCDMRVASPPGEQSPPLVQVKPAAGGRLPLSSPHLDSGLVASGGSRQDRRPAVGGLCSDPSSSAVSRLYLQGKQVRAPAQRTCFLMGGPQSKRHRTPAPPRMGSAARDAERTRPESAENAQAERLRGKE